MKAKFELKKYMSENRNTVIEIFGKLQDEKFYNGISLKEFMMQVLNLMNINNPKSVKKADSLLTSMCFRVLNSNSEIEVINDLDKKMEQKYQGTAYMSMV